MRVRVTAWAATSMAGMALLVAACGGEDRPAVDVIEDGGTSSASGSVSSSGTGSASAPGPGVVEAKPAGAQQADVVLREWAVEPKVATVKAGQVYFLADNQGPEDAHELVIVRTDLAPDKLPVEEGRVPEDEVDLVDEIEPFSAKSQASKTVTLTPGNYVLLCNIAEVEDGELESHYELGMRVAFRVE
ncbi:MAG: hypothetical protein R3B59_08930 [Dehalococcoidia bacterium]